MRRSTPTGRVRPWTLRSRRAAEQTVDCQPRVILSDPEAVAQAARQGLGVALVPMPLFVDYVLERFLSVDFARLIDGR